MAKISERKKLELARAQHAAAKKIAAEFPAHPADQYILQRFVFEPRCEYMGNQKWLVIKDRITDKYLREDDNPRVYRTFRNSWECIQYLRGKFVECKPESGDDAEATLGPIPLTPTKDLSKIERDCDLREQAGMAIANKIAEKATELGFTREQVDMVRQVMLDPFQEFCQREGNCRLVEILNLDPTEANSLTDEAAEVVRDTIDYSENLYDTLDQNLQRMVEEKLGGSVGGE